MNPTANMKALASLVFCALQFLSIAATNKVFPDDVPPWLVHDIAQWSAFIVALFLAFDSRLHWLVDPPRAVVLLALLIGASLLLMTPDVARAGESTQLASRVEDKGGGCVSDGKFVACPPGVGDGALPTLVQNFITWLTTDFTNAMTISQSPPIDVNNVACLTGLQPAATLLSQHPIPLTLKLASDFAAFRKLMIIAHSICENPACTQVFTETTNGIAALGLGIPLPFTPMQLCGKVTPISTVAAVTAPPLPMPSPTPSPTPN